MNIDCPTMLGVLSAIGITIFVSLYVESRKMVLLRPIQRVAPQYPTFKEPFLPPLISGPGNPGLDEPRKPYTLLDLPLLGTNNPSQVNSQNCHAMDFTRLLEKSNYGQKTNNFKHEYPDSCSAPYQEVVLGVYKPESLKLA